MRPEATPKKKGKGVELTNKFEALSEKNLNWIGMAENEGVNAVSPKEGIWERLPIKVDSGAVETVIPQDMARHIQTVETVKSKNGSGFRAANGSHIRHFGQKSLKGYGDEFQNVSMVAQVAEVRTALASVYRMVEAGNAVHFERGNCFIHRLASGAITPMVEKDGGFEIGLWIQSQVESQSGEQGFTRQG